MRAPPGGSSTVEITIEASDDGGIPLYVGLLAECLRRKPARLAERFRSQREVQAQSFVEIVHHVLG